MASFKPCWRSKKATAPCSNSVPAIPRVGRPRSIPIEPQRPLQIVNTESNDRDPRLHKSYKRSAQVHER